MRKVVYGDDGRFIEWASRRIGTVFRPDAKAIGLSRADDLGDPADPERDSEGRRIIASVVFDGFSNTDVNMHVASDGSRLWLNREYLTKCFAFPFIQCGYRRVTGLVPASNADALKFDLHLGFRVEGRCREAMPNGEDVIVLGMLRRDCRFIPKERADA